MEHLKDIRDKTAQLGNIVGRNFEKHVANNQNIRKMAGELEHLVETQIGKLSVSISPPRAVPTGELRDLYGLELKPEHYDDYQKALEKYLKQSRRASAKIESILSRSFSDLQVFAGVVGMGLPQQHRSQLWMLFSGADLRMRENAHGYPTLLLTKGTFDPNSQAVQQIDKDVNRTFTSTNDPEFRTKLRRVLCAYASYNPNVGYCQAMNFLAGGLLLFCEEEFAFWLLSYIVDNMLMEYFSESMTGVIVDIAVLDQLVADRFPQLYARPGLPTAIQLVATQWLTCLFLNAFPPIITFLIWDLIFFHGPKVLFEVALAIFQINQKQLMTMNDPIEMVSCLNDYTSGEYDYLRLSGSIQLISDAVIQSIRQKQRERVMMETRHKEDVYTIACLEKTTHFGPGELGEMLAAFNRLGRPDLTVDFETFSKLFQTVFPADLDGSYIIQRSPDKTPFARKLFNVFDVNHTDSVNFHELICALAVSSTASVDERLHLCFNLFSDKSEKMGKHELASLLDALYSLYYEHGFKKEVSFFVDMMFQDVDKNHDGSLSFEEFKEAAQKQPFIMKCFKLDLQGSNGGNDILQPPSKENGDEGISNPEEWVVM